MISASLWAILLLFVIALTIAGISIYRWQSRRRSGSDSFVKGLLALVENNPETAAKHLRTAATHDTQNIEAFIILGDILRQQGKIAKAKQIHTSLLARAFIKPHQKARVYKSLALDALKEEKLEKSLEYIQQALNAKPDKWAQEFQLDVLERLKRWNEAFESLSKLGGDKGTLALYKVEQGKTLFTKDPHKARVLSKEALKLDHDCVAAMLLIGDAYASENKLKDALEWWTKIIEQFPNKAQMVIQRLEGAYYELGEFDKARTLYHRVLEAHPEADNVRLALAAIYEKMGELNEAKSILQQSPKSSAAVAIAIARIDCIKRDSSSSQQILENLIGQFTIIEYTCSSCGFTSDEPLWRCPKCGEWNSFGV